MPTKKTAAAAVVKASDLAPQAFNGQATIDADKPDDLQYDLHHLAALDAHPVDLDKFKADPEGYLHSVATFGVQGIVDRLFELEYEPSNTGPIVTLPPAKHLILPRAQVIPSAKKETRWEKFAKEKGITNKKRARMLWDEETQEWRPRWGYKRANAGIEDHGIIEVKPGQDPMADPWSEARDAKKARVQKNLQSQQKNKDGPKKDKAGPAFGLPVDLISSKKDIQKDTHTRTHEDGGESKPKVVKKGKEAGKKALEVAQHSTASLGKFDVKLTGEPEKTIKKQKKVTAVADTKALADEGKKMNNILASVLKPKGGSGGASGGKKAPVNIDALEPERAGYARKKGRGAVKGGGKKGKGKGKK